MKSDKAIWNDFKSGENYALSHIYYQNVQLLFRYGKKFCKDEELIKDLIQDLFFDLIRTRSKLGETNNIRFYLLRSFRRKLAKKMMSQTDGKKQQLPDAGITYSVEQELITQEEMTDRQKRIQVGLAELSPKQREILFYKYLCEFDYDQVCEIMQIKNDSARKQVSRALKSLKKILSR